MLSLALALAVAASPPAPAKLKWDPRVDLPVAGVLVSAWAVSELALKKPLAPDACKWCEPNGFDQGVRRAFNPSLTPSASGLSGPDLWSNIVGFGALPVSLLGLDVLLAWRDGTVLETMPVDLVLIIEATFAAQLLNQVVKFTVARGRPYTVDAPPELLATAKDPKDHYLSFFSGHTTFTFAMASAAGTVMTLRGYRLGWLAWVIGMPLAATTSILRMAADKHWMSDVLVGMAVGGVVGAGIPLLFHGRQDGAQVRVSPLPNGVAISGRF